MHELAFRPIQPADDAFLRHVYGTTRAAEIARTGWDAHTVEQFLRMQFDAQHGYYQQCYPQASFDVVLDAGVPAGRLYVDRSGPCVHVIDIALLPPFRNRGIGGALLGALLREAQGSGKLVRIHVEINNPALTLYQRLGFQEVSVTGFHRLMECKPADTAILKE